MTGKQDFNDPEHRLESASAALQRGMYHLFIAERASSQDAFDHVLRLYQAVYGLCLTQWLLDDTVDINKKVKERQGDSRLKRLCPAGTTRERVDPSYFADHSTFDSQNRKAWRGYGRRHPLRDASTAALDLYNKIVEARHNLIYRPFMLDGGFWEDCTLSQLLCGVPSAQDVSGAYCQLIRRMRELAIGESRGDLRWPVWSDRVAMEFLNLLRKEYADRREARPTEGVFLTYARMLKGDDREAVRRAEEWWRRWLKVIAYTAEFRSSP